VPALGLLAVAAIAYFLWPRSEPVVQRAQVPEVAQRQVPVPAVNTPDPSVPDIGRISTDLSGAFASLTSAFGSMKDTASVEAALPKLAELDGKLDAMKALADKLPATGRTKLTALAETGLEKLKGQFAHALMIPGVSEKLRPTLEGIVGKLTAIGGLTPSQFALPSVQATEVGREYSGILASLTRALTPIQDSAAAEESLPALRALNEKLDNTKRSMDKLAVNERATIISVIKSALAEFKNLATKVLAMAGVGDRIKPVVDQILGKLTELTVSG
jgi:hypothetical protein